MTVVVMIVMTKKASIDNPAGEQRPASTPPVAPLRNLAKLTFSHCMAQVADQATTLLAECGAGIHLVWEQPLWRLRRGDVATTATTSTLHMHTHTHKQPRSASKKRVGGMRGWMEDQNECIWLVSLVYSSTESAATTTNH